MFGGWSTCTVVVRSPPTAVTIAAEETHTASRAPFLKKFWLEIEHLVTFDADSFSIEGSCHFLISRGYSDAEQLPYFNANKKETVHRYDIGKL